MKRITKTSPLMLLVLLSLNQTTMAAMTVVKNRSIWSSLVTSPLNVEGFENERVPNTYMMPYTTKGGILITETDHDFFSIYENGSLDGSSQMHFRSWTDEGVTFQFPNGIPVYAFGFDWTSGDQFHQPYDSWKLYVNGDYVIDLNQALYAFTGIIDDSDTIYSFTVKGPSGAQGGIGIDNISWAYQSQSGSQVPAPGSIFLALSGLLFANRIKKKFVE